MRRFTVLLLLLSYVITGLGCGASSVSAPPVSLPTPVTGRITVSSSDADGNISVIGDAGAVTADSTVMAINSSTATSFWYEKLTDFISSNAYAQSDSFPAVCLLAGHSCALADETGAFELTIQGANGDEIIIVLIDPDTGEEISERLTKTVPENIAPVTPAGSTTVPKSVGIDSDFTEVYTLIAPTDSGTNNSITVLNAATGDVKSEGLEVGGAGGTQLLIDPLGATVSDVGATGNSLYSATFDAINTFSSFSQTLLSGLPILAPNPAILGTSVVPTDMLFHNLQVNLNPPVTRDFRIVTSNTPDLSFYFFDLVSPTDSTGYIVSDGAINGTLLGTDAVVAGSIQAGASPYNFIAFLSRFNIDGVTRTVLTIQPEGIFSGWLAQPLNSANLPIVDDFVILPTGVDAVDMELLDRFIFITDQAGDVIYAYPLNAAGVPSNIIEAPEVISITTLVDPQEMTVYARDALKDDFFLFVTVLNGSDSSQDSILTIKPTSLSALAYSSQFTEVCLGPNDLVYDSLHNYLYVSCETSKSVARLSLGELFTE